MEKPDEPLTALTLVTLDFNEFEDRSFGPTNAGATFQRLMESCLGDLLLSCYIIYLDTIFFSQTPEEHLKRVNAVF